MSDEVYEVEAIVGERTYRGKKQYKIHWVGYPSEEDSWEYEKNVDCPELIQEYHEKVKKERREQIEINRSKAPEKKVNRKRHTRKIIGVSKKDGVVSYSVKSSNGEVSTMSSKALVRSMANKLVEFLEALIPEDQTSKEEKEEKSDVLPLIESIDEVCDNISTNTQTQ